MQLMYLPNNYLIIPYIVDMELHKVNCSSITKCKYLPNMQHSFAFAEGNFNRKKVVVETPILDYSIFSLVFFDQGFHLQNRMSRMPPMIKPTQKKRLSTAVLVPLHVHNLGHMSLLSVLCNYNYCTSKVINQ